MRLGFDDGPKKTWWDPNECYSYKTNIYIEKCISISGIERIAYRNCCSWHFVSKQTFYGFVSRDSKIVGKIFYSFFFENKDWWPWNNDWSEKN